MYLDFFGNINTINAASGVIQRPLMALMTKNESILYITKKNILLLVQTPTKQGSGNYLKTNVLICIFPHPFSWCRWCCMS